MRGDHVTCITYVTCNLFSTILNIHEEILKFFGEKLRYAVSGIILCEYIFRFYYPSMEGFKKLVYRLIIVPLHGNL